MSYVLTSKPSLDILRSVKIFLGLRTPSLYRKSRIIRRYNKSFEVFIFKGYDHQTPGIFKPAAFRSLRKVCKN